MSVYAMPVFFLNLWKIRAPCKQRCGFNLEIFDQMIDRARCRTDDYMEPQPLWEYPCYALHKPVHIQTFDFSKDLLNLEIGSKSAVNLDLKTLSKCKPVLYDPRNSRFGTRGSEDASSSDSNDRATEGEGSAGAYDGAAPGQIYYNGVAVWVDWCFGEETVTTGPVEEVVVGQQVTWDMFSQQGVHLPRESFPLLDPCEGTATNDRANFDSCSFSYAMNFTNGAMTFIFEVAKERSPL